VGLDIAENLKHQAVPFHVVEDVLSLQLQMACLLDRFGNLTRAKSLPLNIRSDCWRMLQLRRRRRFGVESVLGWVLCKYTVVENVNQPHRGIIAKQFRNDEVLTLYRYSTITTDAANST